jgi:hypothetical protein
MLDPSNGITKRTGFRSCRLAISQDCAVDGKFSCPKHHKLIIVRHRLENIQQERRFREVLVYMAPNHIRGVDAIQFLVNCGLEGNKVEVIFFGGFSKKTNLLSFGVDYNEHTRTPSTWHATRGSYTEPHVGKVKRMSAGPALVESNSSRVPARFPVSGLDNEARQMLLLAGQRTLMPSQVQLLSAART